MPENLKPVTKVDFSGGLNVTDSPWSLKPNQLLRALNMTLDQTGALSVRDGAVTVEQSPAIPATVDSVLDLQSLCLNDGSVFRLRITRELDATQRLYRSGSPWYQLGIFDLLYDTPTMINYLNQTLITDGYTVPYVTDGNTFSVFPTDMGADMIPGAKWMVVHQNAVWAWNTAATTSTYDGPSSVRQSDVENFGSWPVGNQLFVAKDDGQSGTGMGVFTIAEAGISPDNILVLFKDFSTYQCSGAFGASSAPTITQVKTDMGCIAGRTVQFIPNYGMVRLTHRGFALFNGLNDEVISDNVRPYIFGQNDIAGLNYEKVHLSVATQSQNPPIYICACPSTQGTSGLDRIFIFDVTKKAWTVCTFPYPFATCNLLLEPGILPYTQAGLYERAAVQRIFAGDERDDGVPVSWQVRFPPLPQPMRRAYLRRFLAEFFHIYTGQAVTAEFALGPARMGQHVMQTKQVTSNAQAYPGSGLEEQVEDELYFDIGRTGEVLWTELTGSGCLNLRGCEWQLSQKSLTRPMRI